MYVEETQAAQSELAPLQVNNELACKYLGSSLDCKNVRVVSVYGNVNFLMSTILLRWNSASVICV